MPKEVREAFHKRFNEIVFFGLWGDALGGCPREEANTSATAATNPPRSPNAILLSIKKSAGLADASAMTANKYATAVNNSTTTANASATAGNQSALAVNSS